MGDKLYNLHLTRYILSITESELNELLKANPTIWEKAMRRGKGALRLEKSMQRKG
jgi:hypothetical protein